MEHFNWIKGFWFPYINFFLFAFVLIKVAKKPLTNILQARRKEYESQFLAAKKEREDADRRLEELNTRMANLDNEIAELRQNAEKEAEAEAARIIEQGRVLAEHIKDEAKRIAQAELEKAQKDLNDQLLNLVHAKVSEKLRSELGKEEHSRINASQVSALAGLAAHS